MRSQNSDRPGRRHRISGAVNSNGTIQKGSGFNVVKSAAGTYVITFSNITSIIDFVVSLIGGVSGFCNTGVSGNTVIFVAQNYAATTNVDCAFNFEAEGIAI